MAYMKEFGEKIANLLFNHKMTVKQVHDIFKEQIFLLDDPDGGLPKTYTPDPEWLMDQIIAVKTHPEMWNH